MSSAKLQPSCLGLNALIHMYIHGSLWCYLKPPLCFIIFIYIIAKRSRTKTCRNPFLSDTGSGYFWITATNNFQILNMRSGYHFRRWHLPRLISMKFELAWIIFVHVKSSISITGTLFWSECVPQAWIKRMVTLRTPQTSGFKGRHKSIGCEFYNNLRKRLVKRIEIKICDRISIIKIELY